MSDPNLSYQMMPYRSGDRTALPATEQTRVRTFEARFSNNPEKKSDILKKIGFATELLQFRLLEVISLKEITGRSLDTEVTFEILVG